MREVETIKFGLSMCSDTGYSRGYAEGSDFVIGHNIS